MRASLPRLSTSCNGAIASAAGDDHANSISSGAASPLLAGGSLQVIPQILPLPVRQFFKPAASRGIVMSTGIHDRVGARSCREVGVVRLAVEGELQHSHPGKMKLVAERGHVRRDQSQIFGDERQCAQLPSGPR